METQETRELRETSDLATEEVTSWSEGLTEVRERVGPRFARSEQRQRMGRYLNGLLSPVERKNGWQLTARLA